MGTYGYAAPEYLATGNTLIMIGLMCLFLRRKGIFSMISFVNILLHPDCLGHLSAKSDVYSFGVVLLEMISGRRAIDKNRPPGEQNLVEWAKPLLANRRKTFRLLDTRIERNYSMESAFRLAILASRCLSAEPKFRPSMDEIVTTLNDLQDSKGTGGPRRSRTCKQNTDKDNSHKEATAYPRPSASALFT